MINEIAPHIFSNDMSFEAPKGDDFVLVFDKNLVLVKPGEEVRIPKVAELKARYDLPEEKFEFLFFVDNVSYYMVRNTLIKPFSLNNEEFEFCDIVTYRDMRPQVNGFIISTAFQICRWMEKHKFCGCCGHKMGKSKTERALVCPECGNAVYPTIAPAVTVAITNGDKILLARNAYGRFRKFALVAGFVEIGESFEETVGREVMEEVGLKVKNIRYYKSQPWASSDNEMIGFYVDLDGDDTVTIQEEELAEARWFAREELDPDLPEASLSFEMIQRFRTNEYPK